MVNRYLLVGFLISALFHILFLFSFAKMKLYPKPKEERKYVRVSLSFVKIKKELRKNRILKKQTKKKITRNTNKIKKRKPKKKTYVRRIKKESKKKKIVKKALRKLFAKRKTEIAQKTESKVRETAQRGKSENKVEKNNKKEVIKENINKEPTYISKISKGKDEAKDFIRENLNLIRDLVIENLTYPYIARRMGWEGTVVIAFTLSKDGCEKVRVEKSSGFEILDNEAKNTVEKVCSKFPKPRKRVLVKLPVKFILRD